MEHSGSLNSYEKTKYVNLTFKNIFNKNKLVLAWKMKKNEKSKTKT